MITSMPGVDVILGAEFLATAGSDMTVFGGVREHHSRERIARTRSPVPDACEVFACTRREDRCRRPVAEC
ncbi:hypothetical protein ACWD25_47885 [Streptomyces sp. NPDC002920]